MIGVVVIIGLRYKSDLNKTRGFIKQKTLVNQDIKTLKRNDFISKVIKLGGKNHNNLSGITDIILQNSLGQELSFTRPNELTEVKYQEVMVAEATKVGGHLIQGTMPFLGKARTLAEIAKQAPNGLFTATVDPLTLSKFSDGTTTTMVRDVANKLAGHAGFKPVQNLGKVNPILAVNAAMQATAAISGQYYLHQILGEMNGINSNVEKLIEFHHDEKIGIVLNAKKRLGGIIQRHNIDESDITEIRDLRNKIGEVFEEYKTRLDRECKNIAKFKPGSFLVEKRIDHYGKKVDEMCFTLQVCFQADRLSVQAELAEIAVRMKLKSLDPIREELLYQLQDNYENSFSISIHNKINEIFEPINLSAEKIVGAGKDFVFIDKNPKKLLKDISDKSKKLEKELNTKSGSKIIRQVLSERNEQQEVIIILDEKLQRQRMFVPAVEK